MPEDSRFPIPQPTPRGGPAGGGDGGTLAAPEGACFGDSAATDPRSLTQNLMEQVCARDNLNRAYFKVRSNKGAAGVDGMTVGELH